MPRALTSQEIQSFRTDACAVATRLFAEHGEEGVTLRSLAKELGVSAMTPYRYFENKADIFEAVVEAGFRRLSERSLQIAEEISDPLERLKALGRDYIAFGTAEPHTYQIMFQIDRPGVEDDLDRPAELQNCWNTVVSTIQDAIDAALLHGEATLLAHTCWVALHGMVTLHLSRRLSLGRSLEELADPVMETFIRGSQARPAQGTT